MSQPSFRDKEQDSSFFLQKVKGYMNQASRLKHYLQSQATYSLHTRQGGPLEQSSVPPAVTRRLVAAVVSVYQKLALFFFG